MKLAFFKSVRWFFLRIWFNPRAWSYWDAKVVAEKEARNA